MKHNIIKTSQRSIGQDFAGQEVIATYAEDTHCLRVTFEGIVRPVNKLSVPVSVEVHQATEGGWYVDDPLVAEGFRWDGGWTRPFNVSSPIGRRRIFASRDELEAMLRDGGYTPVPGYSYDRVAQSAA